MPHLEVAGTLHFILWYYATGNVLVWSTITHNQKLKDIFCICSTSALNLFRDDVLLLFINTAERVDVSAQRIFWVDALLIICLIIWLQSKKRPAPIYCYNYYKSTYYRLYLYRRRFIVANMTKTSLPRRIRVGVRRDHQSWNLTNTVRYDIYVLRN